MSEFLCREHYLLQNHVCHSLPTGCFLSLPFRKRLWPAPLQIWFNSEWTIRPHRGSEVLSTVSFALSSPRNNSRHPLTETASHPERNEWRSEEDTPVSAEHRVMTSCTADWRTGRFWLAFPLFAQSPQSFDHGLIPRLLQLSEENCRTPAAVSEHIWLLTMHHVTAFTFCRDLLLCTSHSTDLFLLLYCRFSHYRWSNSSLISFILSQLCSFCSLQTGQKKWKKDKERKEERRKEMEGKRLQA